MYTIQRSHNIIFKYFNNALIMPIEYYILVVYNIEKWIFQNVIQL